MAGAQVVDDTNVVAATNQFFRQMRSDEAGAARYKICRHGVPLSFMC